MPQEATFGGVTALSQDGTIAAGGTSWQPQPGLYVAPGFTWTPTGGRDDFGLLPGMPTQSMVEGMSSDGGVLVGISREIIGPRRSYRRVGNGPVVDIGSAGWSNSEALGVSGDGSVVVGWNHAANGFGQAYRWTEAGGMQQLGYLRPNGTRSTAWGISRDGSTIVGQSQSNGLFGDVEAFKWTEAGGFEALPGLPGAPFVSQEAAAVNADGSVIVGHGPSATPQGHNHALRWTSNGVEDLGTPAGFNIAHAFAVDDSGDVIGGVTHTGGPRSAFVWTPSSGAVLLSDFLLAHGVAAPPGYQLQEILAISGDGMTFGGLALNLTTNIREGFVATIPEPSALVVFFAPLLSRRRRRSSP